MTTEPAKPQLPPGARPSVLSLNINSRSALHAAFMPYLKRGGIFVPTAKPYSIGDEVFMLLSLMDEPGKFPIAGTVVWVTPSGAQGNRTQGIGVQFSEDDSGKAARHKIESILAGYPSTRQTHTL